MAGTEYGTAEEKTKKYEKCKKSGTEAEKKETGSFRSHFGVYFIRLGHFIFPALSLGV